MNILFRFKQHGKIVAISVLLLIFSGIMLDSCIKKDDFEFNKLAGFEWSPNIATPIVNSTLTLRNLINNNANIVYSPTGLLTLIYNKSVYSQRADQLITIPNQSINSSLNFSLGAVTTYDSLSFDSTINFSFNLASLEPNTRLDSIIMKSGYLQFVNPSVNNVRLYISISQVTKNGIPFNRTLVNNPFSTIDTFNLNGYKINLTTGLPNQLTLNYKVTVYGPVVANNYSISLGEQIISPLYSKIFGYFGQIPIALNIDTVSLSVFKNKINGKLFFENPEFIVRAFNSIGVPISIGINKLMAYSTDPTDSIAVTGYPSPSWNIPYPTFSQIGQTLEDTFFLANASIDTAINRSPEYVSLKASALSNPSGITTMHNFVQDTSHFNLELQVNLPLYGMGYITLQDTVKFSFGTTSISQIKWVKFVINTINGFPLGALQQIYFADSSHHKIDSLLTTQQQQTLVAASVGGAPNYMVTSPSSKMLQITITQDFLKHISNVKYLFINSRITTTNNGTIPVMVYSNYNINVKIGVQAQLQTIIYPNHTPHF